MFFASLFVLAASKQTELSHRGEALGTSSRSAQVKDAQRGSLVRKDHRSHQEHQAHSPIRKRHVYIDFGANWANTLRLHKDIADKAEVQSGPWEVYAFEASPLIVPYLDKFVGFLNGNNPKPVLDIPPAGSTAHLARYAPQFGCGGLGGDAAMRECMFRKFQKPLKRMKADTSLMTDKSIRERLATAGMPPLTKDRYVLIPAAAGATNSTMHLGSVDAEQMIRGGAHDNEHTGKQVDVPLVDVVSWLVSNFDEKDYVVVKMDIEGGEFPIVNSLISKGKAGLIDKIAMECHDWVGNCKDLLTRFTSATGLTPLIESKDYQGWDSFSSPEKYVPVKPS